MKNWITFLFLLNCLDGFAQDSMRKIDSALSGESISFSPSGSPARKWLTASVTATGYGGSFILLNRAWYREKKRSKFHTFNDGGEWNQVDKIGHAWSAYTLSSLSSSAWEWAGVQPRTAVVLGTGTSLLYLLSIEYLDGRSAEWGWSWPDVFADLAGASIYAGQQLGWKEQKAVLKFSAHRKNYSDPGLENRANSLFGASLPERLLKDYNQQTYWLSINLKELFPRTQLPSWLNLAIGYGAEGMFGGYENIAFDEGGAIVFDRRDLQRYRQWYLAPDIDLTRIKTRSAFLRTVFTALNSIKIPAPSLEFSNNRFRFNALSF